jgi:hypothetical protein
MSVPSVSNSSSNSSSNGVSSTISNGVSGPLVGARRRAVQRGARYQLGPQLTRILTNWPLDIVTIVTSYSINEHIWLIPSGYVTVENINNHIMYMTPSDRNVVWSSVPFPLELYRRAVITSRNEDDTEDGDSKADRTASASVTTASSTITSLGIDNSRVNVTRACVLGDHATILVEYERRIGKLTPKSFIGCYSTTLHEWLYIHYEPIYLHERQHAQAFTIGMYWLRMGQGADAIDYFDALSMTWNARPSLSSSSSQAKIPTVNGEGSSSSSPLMRTTVSQEAQRSNGKDTNVVSRLAEGRRDAMEYQSVDVNIITPMPSAANRGSNLAAGARLLPRCTLYTDDDLLYVFSQSSATHRLYEVLVLSCVINSSCVTI